MQTEELKTGTAAETLPPSSAETLPPSSAETSWTKSKLDNPFGRIKPSTVPTSSEPCEKATLEWKTNVKDRASAIEWHLKWTPWFSPQMIEGIVDFGYKKTCAHQ